MIFKTVLLCFLPFLLVAEEPWGRDSHLLFCSPCRQKPPASPLQKLAHLLIGFHQKVISPADGPRSHFRPSSSQYTLEAIDRYGFCLGVACGCDRLMRENSEPWVYRQVVGDYNDLLKWDPVK